MTQKSILDRFLRAKGKARFPKQLLTSLTTGCLTDVTTNDHNDIDRLCHYDHLLVMSVRHLVTVTFHFYLHYDFSFTLSQLHHDREMSNKLSVIICCERLRKFY